jgi:yersiniabactin salicyl-AMP ligase
MIQLLSDSEQRAAYYEEKGYWKPLTLGDHLKSWGDSYGNRIALVQEGRHMSYAELNRGAAELAAGFYDLGLQKGDRVLVQLPNNIEFVLSCFALFRLGAIPILSMPANRFSEIDAFCTLAEPVAYITTNRFLGFDYHDLAHGMMAKHASLKHLISDNGEMDGSLALNSLKRSFKEMPDPHYRDPAVLLLSGGTSGTPKLIPRTHTHYAYNATASAAICKFSKNTVYLAVLPAAHNFPFACPGILGTLSVGGRVVLSQTTSCDEAFPLIEEERVTVTSLVPALVNFWLEARKWDESDLSSLSLLQVGGAPLSEALAAEIEPVLGCRLQQVFGMAEGLLCYTHSEDADEVVLTTQGRPLSEDDELRLVDEHGNDVPAGEEGELLVRGPYTIQGYYRAPEDNERSFTPDGYYRSGDIARLTPEGNIQVIGRVKDQINRAGEKISAAEVESHLCAHPDIKEVALVGLPDEELGERSCAFVESANRDLDLPTIHKYLQQRGLARYKMPDQLEIVEAWPLTNVGKINKRELISKALERNDK